MKKTLLIFSLLGIVVITLGIAGYAYAQDQNPDPECTSGRRWMGETGPGRGGMMGGYGMVLNGEENPMHEAMVAAVAETLGLTPEEIEARHDAGGTLWEIAESKGISSEEIQDLMVSAHDAGLEEAIANGWITAEQAEWMNEHMNQMWDGDFGFEAGNCGSRGQLRSDFPWQEGQN